MKLEDFDAAADKIALSPEPRHEGWWVFLLAVALCLAFIFFCYAAFAHGDAEWIEKGAYLAENGTHCCGEHDCSRITDESAVKRTADGWVYADTFFPDTQHGHGLYATEREDPFFCAWGGKVRCLFVTPEGT